MSCIICKIRLGGFSRELFYVSLLVLSIIGLSGCGEEEAPKSTSKKLEYSEQNVTLDLEVSDTEGLLVDDIEISLTAKAPAGWRVEFPEESKELGEFELVATPEKSDKIDPKTNDNISVLKFYISALLSGEQEIPEMVVTFTEVDTNKKISLTTEPVNVKINSVIGNLDDAELKDIAEIAGLKKDYVLWYVSGIVGFTVLCVIIIYIVVRYLKRRAEYRALCRPFFVALKKIEQLEKSGNIEKGLDDMVYTAVSDILRYYIESRFGITASKSTTEEFLLSISDEKLLINSYSDLLKDFLLKCDGVKFAKYEPSEEECRDVINSCKNFVLETKLEEIKYNKDSDDNK